MKNKKIPMRSCVVTHEKLEKKDLLRIVRTPEGKIEIDETGKLNGRGAYIKKEVNVINKAKQTKALEKHLKIKIEDELYDKMIMLIKK